MPISKVETKANSKAEKPEEAKAPPNLAVNVLTAMAKDKGQVLHVMGRDIPQAERIPTGLLDVDLAIGGGFPRGRIVILYGKEGSLKTTLALKAAANVQRQKRPDNKVVMVDLEGTYDAGWAAKSTGVDNDALLVAKPRYAEECADIVQAMVHADDVGLVIIDSLGVFANAKELAGSSDDRQQGGSAWVGNAMIRKIIWGFADEAVKGHRPCVIVINHPRIAVGPVPVEWMPGGKLQLTQSALTLKMTGTKIISKVVDPLSPTWHQAKVEIKKAKVGVTRHAFDFDLCMIAHDHMKVGQTDTWTVVSTALKEFGFLVKVSSGWTLLGKAYPNLLPIQQRYNSDQEFAVDLQQKVTQETMKRQFLV